VTGKFIVIEGIDGSGSTTMTRRLAAEITASGNEPLVTQEPSPGPVGKFIRDVLQHRIVVARDGGAGAPDWTTMALLFAADRADHTERVVEPALAQGRVVLSDRYTLSGLAYQSLTAPEGSADLAWLRELNRRALVASLVIVVDVRAEVAAERRARRGGERELFEVDALQRRLAEAYSRAEEYLGPGHLVAHVDGNRSEDEVYADVRAHALTAIAR
jgi:dTMP kinase